MSGETRFCTRHFIYSHHGKPCHRRLSRPSWCVRFINSSVFLTRPCTNFDRKSPFSLIITLIDPTSVYGASSVCQVYTRHGEEQSSGHAFAGTNRRIRKRQGCRCWSRSPGTVERGGEEPRSGEPVGRGRREGLVCAGSGGRVQLSMVGCGAPGWPVTSFAIGIPKLQPDGRRSPQLVEAI